MVCLDANYFLRALVEPISERAQREHRLAVKLFAAAGRGEVEMTATAVALHEVLYVLTNKREHNGYGYIPAEACARVRALIDLPSFKHPQKRTILVTPRHHIRETGGEDRWPAKRLTG